MKILIFHLKVFTMLIGTCTHSNIKNLRFNLFQDCECKIYSKTTLYFIMKKVEQFILS